MAGAMRKMAVYLGLVEDAERYDDYDDRYEAYDGYDERADPRHDPRHDPETDPRARAPHDPAMPAGRPERGASVATLADRRPVAVAASAAELARITTLHPRTYNEARTIGEHFRDGVPVIMNLSEMDDTDAKRLVDFAAGLIFGLRGSIERVTAKVFLLSPDKVTVTAEDKARIAEGGFFNQS